ncbi:hypothetical protein CWB41_08415 [Methylovirgula ligni]|nr:hypothetical protein CWB41_08415 [Methylovirgula ligni]
MSQGLTSYLLDFPTFANFTGNSVRHETRHGRFAMAAGLGTFPPLTIVVTQWLFESNARRFAG